MNEFSILIEAYIREKQETKKLNYCAVTWLDSASRRASQLSIATHVLKFIHSDAKGTNIYETKRDCSRKYLSTSSLGNVRPDVVGNAAAMDIAGLLNLEVNGVTFLDLVSKNDSTPLKYFATNEEQVSGWMAGFKAILSERDLSSHTLAKQVYFPIEDGEYHLLSPLYPSSLGQALYDQIKEDRFGEQAKRTREHKKNKKYSDLIVVDYPNLAVQTFGGTKPQNISRLNSLRGGKVYLLNNSPPFWKSIDKPPKREGAFWKIFERRAKTEIINLKSYIKWSKNNKDVRYLINTAINRLIEILLQTAAEIQVMTPEWSVDSELTLHEKLWLDPFCKESLELRCVENWKQSIASHFGTFLIKKLEKNSFSLSDTECRHLTDMCFKSIKEVE